MFDQVPAQAWLLIAAAGIGYAPARYVVRYFAHAPSRHDITRPAEDLGWRTTKSLAGSIAALTALVAFGIFIFTPAARHLAHSPDFPTLLATALGAWSLFTSVRGFATGHVEPFVRGLNRSYSPDLHPRRFWLSLAWNAALGCLLIGSGWAMHVQAAREPLEERCYDRQTAYLPQDSLAACNALVADGGAPAESAGVMNARGRAHHRLGEYDRAMADYGAAIRLDPNSATPHFNRGLIYDSTGYYPRALAEYGEAIRLDGDNADAYVSRGAIFLNSGKLDQAIADFTRARALIPRDPWPPANRGLAYAWKKDRARAEQDFAAARALDPANPILLHGEALLGMQAGDMPTAIDRLTAALKQDPKDKWALAQRATAYRRAGEIGKAQADLDSLQRLMNDAQASPGTARH